MAALQPDKASVWICPTHVGLFADPEQILYSVCRNFVGFHFLSKPLGKYFR